jgi:hypothetical protein
MFLAFLVSPQSLLLHHHLAVDVSSALLMLFDKLCGISPPPSVVCRQTHYYNFTTVVALPAAGITEIEQENILNPVNVGEVDQ